MYLGLSRLLQLFLHLDMGSLSVAPATTTNYE